MKTARGNERSSRRMVKSRALVSMALVAAVLPAASVFAQVEKAPDNSNFLNVGSSWIGGFAPTARQRQRILVMAICPLVTQF